MMRYARLNAHGVPDLTSTHQGDDMVEVPDGIDPMTHMCPSGIWVPRPRVELSVQGNRIDLAGMPPGTVLEVIDVGASATLLTDTLEGDESLMLVDPGSYQIEVTPPMPWLGWTGAITC